MPEVVKTEILYPRFFNPARQALLSSTRIF
jgi:hypothetical protein